MSSSSSLFAPQTVRDTCSQYKSDHVNLSQEHLSSFFQEELQVGDLKKKAQIDDTTAFPELQFASLEDEVGFITLVHALDFGSGFRIALHKRRNGQGAWLTIRAGCVNLGKLSTKTEADFLLSFDLAAVSRLFDIDNCIELEPLAEQIHSVLQEIGHSLKSKSFVSLSEFTKRFVSVEKDASLEEEKNQLVIPYVHSLVDSFPLTFRDEYTIGDKNVRLYKKAQLVVSEVHSLLLRSGVSGFGDINELTAFVDNVVVATLRKGGVLQCSKELSSCLDSNTPIKKGSEFEVGLRATGVVAVSELTQLWNKTFSPQEPLSDATLCNFLWGKLGKRPDYRSFPRHYAPDTLFY